MCLSDTFVCGKLCRRRHILSDKYLLTKIFFSWTSQLIKYIEIGEYHSDWYMHWSWEVWSKWVVQALRSDRLTQANYSSSSSWESIPGSGSAKPQSSSLHVSEKPGQRASFKLDGSYSSVRNKPLATVMKPQMKATELPASHLVAYLKQEWKYCQWPLWVEYLDLRMIFEAKSLLLTRYQPFHPPCASLRLPVQNTLNNLNSRKYNKNL